MVGETEIRKAFSLSLNGTTVEPGCIYGGPDEAPTWTWSRKNPAKRSSGSRTAASMSPHATSYPASAGLICM